MEPSRLLEEGKEQELLRELFDSRKAEFIAIYGRRRVGKAYLIKNLIDTLPAVFFHVSSSESTLVEDMGSTILRINLL